MIILRLPLQKLIHVGRSVLVALPSVKAALADAGFTVVPTAEIQALLDTNDTQMRDGDTARDCWLGRSSW